MLLKPVAELSVACLPIGGTCIANCNFKEDIYFLYTAMFSICVAQTEIIWYILIPYENIFHQL